MIPDPLNAATGAAVAALLSSAVHVSEGEVSWWAEGLTRELVTENGASVVPLVSVSLSSFPVWLVWWASVCPGQ